MAESTTFAEKLKKSREKRGFTQLELGEKTGLPSTTIAHLEGGDRKPSFDNLKRLADALHVSTDYLLGRADNPSDITTGIVTFRNAEMLTKNDVEFTQNIVDMLIKRRQET